MALVPTLGLQLVMEERPKHSRSPRKDPDPVVGYMLYNYFFEREEAFALTTERFRAQSIVYDLANGPYTSGDIDVRPVRRSELRGMR